MLSDEHYMQQALLLAKRAEEQDEVPIGALVVLDDKIIGEGWNQSIQNNDPSAHAEIMAIRAAGKYLGNYRLAQAKLYTTLEPCLMCAGAIIHARLAHCIVGAFDQKSGALSSQLAAFTLPMINHRPQLTTAVLQQSCGEILSNFFQRRRA